MLLSTKLADLTLEGVVAQGSFWPMPKELVVTEWPAPHRTPRENADIIKKLRYRDAFVRYQAALVEFCRDHPDRFGLVIQILTHLQMDHWMNDRQSFGGCTEARTWFRETGPASMREIFLLARRTDLGFDAAQAAALRTAEAGDDRALSAHYEGSVPFEQRMEQLFALIFLGQPDLFIAYPMGHPQSKLDAWYSQLESGDYAYLQIMLPEALAKNQVA